MFVVFINVMLIRFCKQCEYLTNFIFQKYGAKLDIYRYCRVTKVYVDKTDAITHHM